MPIVPECDPLRLHEQLWGYPSNHPHHTYFYSKQREIIYSVRDNSKTVVVAGNKLGKDFVSSYICLWFFLHPAETRIVTTSVKADHLNVLWGEIGRWINRCKYPLLSEDGGPLYYTQRSIEKIVNGSKCPISYIKGMVSAPGKSQGLAGHHAARTLFIVDEACHDDQTEVLTDAGWKLFADVADGDRLLTMDPSTGIANYEVPTHIHAAHYRGPMYLYEQRATNFCVTPYHRMLWRDNTAEPFRLSPVEEISEGKCIPRKFKWVGVDPGYFEVQGVNSQRTKYPTRQFPIRLWCEFMGWVFSEGSLIWYRGVPSGLNLAQKAGPAKDRIVAIVKELGLRCVITSQGVNVTDWAIARYVFRHGRYCHEKWLPEFIGTLTPELIEVFLQAYTAGDGYSTRGGREVIYTSSKQIADELQILSYKTGRPAGVTSRDMVGRAAPNGVTRHVGYVVGRSTKKVTDTEWAQTRVRKKNLQVVDYDGMVYCATVPTHHTLFTRRKGSCLWSGNSNASDETFDAADGWAGKQLFIGNPTVCSGRFYRDCKAGDLLAAV